MWCGRSLRSWYHSGMSDAWLVIGIFVFAFILWVSTGGPTRPISFAGPYITPITDVDDTQEGYGEDINVNTGSRSSSLFSVRSIFGRFENSVGEEENVGPVSPHADKVRITSRAGGPGKTEPDEEYVAIRAVDASVDVTGFTLASSRTGMSAVIPQAPLTPGGTFVNVVLEDGDEAFITTGNSPFGTSYKENTCTQYADSYREYKDCAQKESGDPDFFGDTWRIYLGRESELWRSDDETIRLLDREGRTVDIYTY